MMRFSDLKVGDQLVLNPRADWHRGIPEFWIVTDLWFDPVNGQYKEASGRMAAIQRIRGDGELFGNKRAHSLRGLASQGYKFAEKDVIAERKACMAAMRQGVVVGIGKGQLIRARPKLPGGL